MPRRLVLLALLLLPTGARAASIEEIFTRVEVLLADSFGRSIPLVAASAGVNYHFDAATGSFVRDPSIVGQLFLERADPIGKARWNAALSYQWVALDSIQGQPANDLNDPVPIQGESPNVPVVLLSHADIGVTANQFTASLTYGVTDDLEVNLTIPMIYSNLSVSVDFARIVFPNGPDGLPDPAQGRIEGGTIEDEQQPFGVGDIALRAKYRFLERDLVHAAGGLVLRLPSGDQDQLQGTGDVEVSPLLYLSTRIFEPAPWARVQGYLNAGVDFVANDVNQSEARWGVGLDWAPVERATVAIAFLGRNPFSRPAPAGFFDVPRCTTSITNCTTEMPIFGLTSERPDYYDFSFGGRVSLWRDTVIGFANVLVPLNDAGIRTRPVPLVGIEAAF